MKRNRVENISDERNFLNENYSDFDNNNNTINVNQMSDGRREWSRFLIRNNKFPRDVIK